MEPDKQLKPENLDYSLAAIAPAFIISMIGSLVYFLVVLFYPGQQTGRLMWVLGLYTFASVLIARIAIEQSRAQSIVYMAGLGAATLLVIPRLFTASGSLAFLSIPFLVLILILIAYLADRITFDCTLIHEGISSQGAGLLQSIGLFRKEPRDLTKAVTPPEGRQRKHNQGVWVLYFSFLAIPIFGIGQFFMSPNSDRAFANRMVFVYLFSSLSLLVLIALLTLRKYLRERNIPMEISFATQWIMMGVAAVAALVLVFAFLPLPSQPLWNWQPPFEIARRDDLQPHPQGIGPDGVEAPERQGQQGAKPAEGDKADGKKGDAAGKGDDAEKGDPAGKGDAAEKAAGEGEEGGEKDKAPNEAANRNNSWQINWNGSSLLSWLLLLILLLIALVWGWTQRQAMLRFLSELFGWKPAVKEMDAEPTSEDAPEHLSPFSSFTNPFSSPQLNPEQIVRHTFRALIAWGREHRLVRGEEETPDEFVRRVARKYSEQQSSLIHLGHLYGRIAYAKSRVQRTELDPLKELWVWWESSLR